MDIEKVNVTLAFICGAFGGMIKFSMGIINTVFILNLLQAALTAFICGAMGVAGKKAYDFGIKKLNKYREQRTKRKTDLQDP